MIYVICTAGRTPLAWRRVTPLCCSKQNSTSSRSPCLSTLYNRLRRALIALNQSSYSPPPPAPLSASHCCQRCHCALCVHVTEGCAAALPPACCWCPAALKQGHPPQSSVHAGRESPAIMIECLQACADSRSPLPARTCLGDPYLSGNCLKHYTRALTNAYQHAPATKHLRCPFSQLRQCVCLLYIHTAADSLLSLLPYQPLDVRRVITRLPQTCVRVSPQPPLLPAHAPPPPPPRAHAARANSISRSSTAARLRRKQVQAPPFAQRACSNQALQTRERARSSSARVGARASHPTPRRNLRRRAAPRAQQAHIAKKTNPPCCPTCARAPVCGASYYP